MIHGGRISGLEACGCWHPAGCQCGADECGDDDDPDPWPDSDSDGWGSDGWDI